MKKIKRFLYFKEMPRGLHGLSSSSEINWSKYKKKKYLQLDIRAEIKNDEHMQAKI